jgi:hypothetical protein
VALTGYAAEPYSIVIGRFAIWPCPATQPGRLQSSYQCPSSRAYPVFEILPAFRADGDARLGAKWAGMAMTLSATLSGYMGKSDAFDQANAAFSMACADQNESDHAALERAVRRGKVTAVFAEVR